LFFLLFASFFVCLLIILFLFDLARLYILLFE
jgi:hypothetical protein